MKVKYSIMININHKKMGTQREKIYFSSIFPYSDFYKAIDYKIIHIHAVNIDVNKFFHFF